MSSDSPATDSSRRVARIGKYEILKHIATGGMGAVYKARDTEEDREVALKVLTAEMAAKPAMLVRFKREAEHASKLRHDNVVNIYEFGESNGTFYMAMEFVEGIDLHEYITRKGKVTPEASRQIMIQAARALEHAHLNNIVHRDIKPSNFLLARQNGKIVVKLTDLGLARNASNEEFRVTRAGTTVGTVDYIAPEQARDSGSADIRSDLYSLGCTWFHMLAGRPPFPDGSLAERLCKHMMDDPPDVRTFNPLISADLVEVLGRLMAKKASDRYESPAELLAVLQSLKAVEEPCKETEAAADDEQEELVTDDAASSSRRDTVLEQKSPTGSQPIRESEAARGRYVGTRRAPPTPARKVLEPEPAPKKSKPSIKKTDTDPKFAYVVGGGIGIIVLLVMVLVAVIRSKNRARDDSADRPAPAPPPIAAVDPPKIPDPPKVIPDQPILVAKPKYPALYKPAVAVDAASLRQVALGPWSKLPALPADAPTLRVVRIADGLPQTYTSLAAACAAAPDKGAIIEIHDNGPLYETGAAITGKRLFIRGVLGYRPLIVWDVLRTLDELKLKKITQPQPFTFLSGQKANLTLEGLEIVMRWPETAIPGSITLVQNHEGDVTLRNCVFSFKGPAATAITLVRITGGAGARTGPDFGPVRCRVRGCYARCSTLTALDLQVRTSDVLVEDSLLAGDSRPLLRLKAATGSPTNLRLAALNADLRRQLAQRPACQRRGRQTGAAGPGLGQSAQPLRSGVGRRAGACDR